MDLHQLEGWTYLHRLVSCLWVVFGIWYLEFVSNIIPMSQVKLNDACEPKSSLISDLISSIDEVQHLRQSLEMSVTHGLVTKGNLHKLYWYREVTAEAKKILTSQVLLIPEFLLNDFVQASSFISAHTSPISGRQDSQTAWQFSRSQLLRQFECTDPILTPKTVWLRGTGFKLWYDKNLAERGKSGILWTGYQAIAILQKHTCVKNLSWIACSCFGFNYPNQEECTVRILLSFYYL